LLFHFLSVRGVDVLAFADFFSSASTRKANLTLRLYIFSALQETHCCSDTDRHSSSPTKALLSWKGNNTNLANAHLAKKKNLCTHKSVQDRLLSKSSALRLWLCAAYGNIVHFSLFDVSNLLAVVFSFSLSVYFDCASLSVGCNAPPCTESGNSGVH
jgi:hypothetical protein